MTLRDLLLNMGNDTTPEDYDAALAEYDALVLSCHQARVIAERMSRTPAGVFDDLLARAENAEAEIQRLKRCYSR